MRALALILACLPFAAVASDSLAIAQRFQQNGLPGLAALRVDRDQPASPGAPDWIEWESLRLTLLSQTGRPRELLDRVAALPATVPPEFRQKALGHAAWAHLELKEGGQARDALARLIWRFPLSPEDQRWARRLVIRAWLLEDRADEAYRAMLRYQQDYAPVGRDVATEFVQGLLRAGRANEALTWFSELDPAGPVATLLALKAGFITPEAALARARPALDREPSGIDWLRVALEAAGQANDTVARVDLLERLVAAGAEDVGPLWTAWLRLGEATGNRAQLLIGDDAAWLAMAEGLAPTAALEARAVHAHLTQRGVEAASRETARRRLLAGLLAARREAVAVRLLEASPWGGGPPTPEAAADLFARVATELPGSDRRLAWLAAARYAEGRGRFDLAADQAAQAVLASDMANPDLIATRALKATIDDLERAGLREEALAFHRRMVALRAPAPAPAKPATKAGRREKRP